MAREGGPGFVDDRLLQGTGHHTRPGTAQATVDGCIKAGEDSGDVCRVRRAGRMGTGNGRMQHRQPAGPGRRLSQVFIYRDRQTQAGGARLEQRAITNHEPGLRAIALSQGQHQIRTDAGRLTQCYGEHGVRRWRRTHLLEADLPP